MPRRKWRSTRRTVVVFCPSENGKRGHEVVLVRATLGKAFRETKLDLRGQIVRQLHLDVHLGANSDLEVGWMKAALKCVSDVREDRAAHAPEIKREGLVSL